MQSYLSYGATVLWALAAIVVNQYAFSPPVTIGAALGLRSTMSGSRCLM